MDIKEFRRLASAVLADERADDLVAFEAIADLSMEVLDARVGVEEKMTPEEWTDDCLRRSAARARGAQLVARLRLEAAERWRETLRPGMRVLVVGGEKVTLAKLDAAMRMARVEHADGAAGIVGYDELLPEG